MARWTLTTYDGGKVHGYEANPVLAYKTAVELAQVSGGIITVDDLETNNTLFHTEAVAQKRTPSYV